MKPTPATVEITAKVAKISHPDFTAGYGYAKDKLIFYSKINGQEIEYLTPEDLNLDNPFDLPAGLLAGIAAIIPNFTFIKNK